MKKWELRMVIEGIGPKISILGLGISWLALAIGLLMGMNKDWVFMLPIAIGFVIFLFLFVFSVWLPFKWREKYPERVINVSFGDGSVWLVINKETEEIVEICKPFKFPLSLSPHPDEERYFHRYTIVNNCYFYSPYQGESIRVEVAFDIEIDLVAKPIDLYKNFKDEDGLRVATKKAVCSKAVEIFPKISLDLKNLQTTQLSFQELIKKEGIALPIFCNVIQLKLKSIEFNF